MTAATLAALLLTLAVPAYVTAPASAAVLVLDDFTTGPLDVTFDSPEGPSSFEQTGAMLGGERAVARAIRTSGLGFGVGIRIDPTPGVLSLSFTGDVDLLFFGIAYGPRDEVAGRQPLNADWRGFTALEVVVDELIGASGRLSATIGSGEGASSITQIVGGINDLGGPAILRIPLLDEAGAPRLDLADIDSLSVRWDLNRPFDPDASGRIVFSEIRLIPEPGAVGVVALGLALAGARRRRE